MSSSDEEHGEIETTAHVRSASCVSSASDTSEPSSSQSHLHVEQPDDLGPEDNETEVSGSETDSEDDDESVHSQSQELETARPLPDRTFVIGGQQFSVFSQGNPTNVLSHRVLDNKGADPYDDDASRSSDSDNDDSDDPVQEDPSSMRRVTASLLEILTQVAAVSKEEPVAKGHKDDLESVTLYDQSSLSSVDVKSHHVEDLDVDYQTNMRRLTSTLVDLLGAMSKGGKEGKEFLLKGDAAVHMEDALLKDPESGLKNLSANPFESEVIYNGDNILPFNSEPEDEPVDESSIPAVFKKKRRINWIGSLISLIFLGVFGFYIWFRAAYTMGVGSYLWYAIVVFVVEIIGGLAVIPYALTLLMRVENEKPPELDGKGLPATVLHYHIRVLIPCYREPLSVVQKTFLAAMTSPAPAGCQKSVYLCDDGKDPEKRAFVRSLGRSDAHYVSGRPRQKGEMNGKSANINNIARLLYPANVAVPLSEVICIFDADQVPNPDFFLKMVPLLDAGQDVGMVLSPQTFYNLNPDGDIFNHANVHFWDYTQPGYDALGLISCTGTNFLVRSKAFIESGGFPEWTLTEDFALGIELKKRKWQCRYVEEYLAIGEAPEDVRNCFQQRSRWAKGHFQTFFSRHCPLFQRGLSLLMRLLYSSVILSYLANFTSTPMLMLVPMITIWVGVFPIVINFYAGVCVTAYYVASSSLMYYARSRSHFKAMWFASVCNAILWFAFLKAAYRATIGKYLTGQIVFKSTLKGLQKIKDSALRDVWMALLVLSAQVASFIVGVIHISNGPLKSPLIISLLWVVYNAVPQVLLLLYAVLTARWRAGQLFAWACKLAMLLSLGTAVGAIVLIWPMIPPTYQYSQPLTMQWDFYDAQMSGALPQDNDIKWRSDANVADKEAVVYDARYYGNWTASLEQESGDSYYGDSSGADNYTTMDLEGGFYTGMAGGLLKATFPEAFATTLLSWGVISFPRKYADAKSTNHALSTIRHATDYLMKLMEEDPIDENNTAIVSRVGRVDVEMEHWARPEDETEPRPAFSVHVDDGASDIAGSVAAALAAAAVAFKTTDPSYSELLTETAVKFWHFGNMTLAKYTETDIDSQLVYNSSSYYDDLAWGAAWLYRATKDDKWFSEMIHNYVQHMHYEGKQDFYYAFDWDHVFWPTNLVMAQYTDLPTFHNQTKTFLKQWICSGSTANYTLYGRAYNPHSGSLGATANAVFMSTMYAELVKDKDPESARVYECWALSQLRYMLGDSGQSFVVGYGPSAPKRTQDRGAACPNPPMKCNAVTGLLSPEPDPHSLRGALVEGSGLTDTFKDIRNSNSSRVGIENNVGLTGALVGVLDYPAGLWEICLQNYGVYTINPVCGSSFML